MSKPRPVIEIVSAQPMSKIGDGDFSSGVTSPPRHPPTVIRPSSAANPPVRPSVSHGSRIPDTSSRLASVIDSPTCALTITTTTTTDGASNKDVNENSVPHLPLKVKGTSAISANESSVTTTNSSSSVKADSTRKQPPPRPPKAPTRAKKLAKQQRGDSPVENAVERQKCDSPVTNHAAVPKECVSVENDTTSKTLGEDKDDYVKRSSSIPPERAPPPPSSATTLSGPQPPSSSTFSPPVPPHGDDYDPDTYEYMEPIDSLHRPPYSPSNDGAASGLNGVATDWKPISPTIGGPEGEVNVSCSPGAGPPKPRRSFKGGEEGKQDPTRLVFLFKLPFFHSYFLSFFYSFWLIFTNIFFLRYLFLLQLVYLASYLVFFLFFLLYFASLPLIDYCRVFSSYLRRFRGFLLFPTQTLSSSSASLHFSEQDSSSFPRSTSSSTVRCRNRFPFTSLHFCRDYQRCANRNSHRTFLYILHSRSSR